MNEREKLVRAARNAAAVNLGRYRPGMLPDLSYLEKASDERLWQVVRSVYPRSSLDKALSGPFMVA